MSDLYDSLEDEGDEYKHSSDFLDRCKTRSPDSVRWDRESDSAENYSFFLSENLNKESQNLKSIFQFSNILPEKKNFLPQIKNIARVGAEPVPNAVVDSKSLGARGLQLNDDGSYTKSPRQELEELPFITREYRNLQFQKKKTYMLKKKSSVAKQQKKNIFSFTEPSDGINMTQIINARKKKGSEEKLLTDGRSPAGDECQTKSDKQFPPNYNLTDSMKEKLLGTCRLEKQPKELKNIKLKSKHEINTHETIHQQNKVPATGRKKENHAEHFSPKETLHRNSSDTVSDVKKIKNLPQKISKYKSDILLNGVKPKLNYSERHQLQSGFNPLYLRHEGKKIPSDTNRSNFGDSEMEELPEVSSRVVTRDNLGDEEEEMFYRKLMEKDRNQMQTHDTSRSEGRVQQLSLKRITGPTSHKGGDEKTMSGRNNSRPKHNSKSLFIDMPSEGDHSVIHLKKFSHYCSNHSSPNISKVELALKARTYGYLANARNIFRLKAQSDRGKNQKMNENISTLSKNSSGLCLPTSGKLTKQHSLPVNGFPSAKNSPSRRIESMCKLKQPEMGSPAGFALPQVNNSTEMKAGKMNARLFERINYCLKGPNV